MKGDHIINLLDENRIDMLGESELATIKAHTPGCPECLHAYRAAIVSADLLKARAAETIEPPPFFKTRVMAAIKEKRLALQPSALLRMWKSAGALVSAMVAAVIILLTLTFAAGGFQPSAEPSDLSVGQNLSIDHVVLDEPNQAIDDNQVFDTMFGPEEGYGQYQ